MQTVRSAEGASQSEAYPPPSNHDWAYGYDPAWNEENRLTAVIEGGGRHVTRFLYDAAGERVVKQGRGGDGITVGQFFNLKGKVAATKHVFVGETRLASKLLPPPGWNQGLVPLTTASPGATLPGCDPSDRTSIS